jgi:peroxiredoxin
MKKIYPIFLCFWFLSLTICNGQDCSGSIFETISKLENAGIKFPYSNLFAVESFEGCNFPDFSTKTIAGDSISLRKLRGKVVVINFWFEGCQPCITEMPALNKLAKEFSASEVVFIAWSRDNANSVREFLKENAFKYQHLANASSFVKKYGLALGGWPVNIIIDKKGVVRHIKTGGPPGDEDFADLPYHLLRPYISACLKGKL